MCIFHTCYQEHTLELSLMKNHYIRSNSTLLISCLGPFPLSLGLFPKSLALFPQGDIHLDLNPHVAFSFKRLGLNPKSKTECGIRPKAVVLIQTKIHMHTITFVEKVIKCVRLNGELRLKLHFANLMGK